MPFFHSFNKYLLSTYNVLDNLLDCGDATGKVRCSIIRTLVHSNENSA